MGYSAFSLNVVLVQKGILLQSWENQIILKCYLYETCDDMSGQFSNNRQNLAPQEGYHKKQGDPVRGSKRSLDLVIRSNFREWFGLECVPPIIRTVWREFKAVRVLVMVLFLKSSSRRTRWWFLSCCTMHGSWHAYDGTSLSVEATTPTSFLSFPSGKQELSHSLPPQQSEEPWGREEKLPLPQWAPRG